MGCVVSCETWAWRTSAPLGSADIICVAAVCEQQMSSAGVSAAFLRGLNQAHARFRAAANLPKRDPWWVRNGVSPEVATQLRLGLNIAVVAIGVPLVVNWSSDRKVKHELEVLEKWPERRDARLEDFIVESVVNGRRKEAGLKPVCLQTHTLHTDKLAEPGVRDKIDRMFHDATGKVTNAIVHPSTLIPMSSSKAEECRCST